MPLDAGQRLRFRTVLATVGRLAAGIWLLAAVCSPAAAAAAETVGSCAAGAPPELRQDPQWIHHGFEVLFDPERRYRLDDVLGPARCSQFRAVPGPADFGYRAPAVWLRFGLPQQLRDAPGWRALVLYGRLDRVCLHWPVLPSPQYHSECADHRQPMASGARAWPGWYFAVPASIDVTRPALLYAQGNITIEVQLALGTPDGFVNHLYLRQTWIGTFYGLMFGVALLGVVMFVTQRDRTYLYFAVNIVLFTLYIAVQSGAGSPLGMVGTWVNRLSGTLAALSMLAATPFYQRFLETAKYARRVHRALMVVALLYAVPGVLQVGSPNKLTLTTSVAFGLLWLVLLLATMLVRLRQGSRAAAFGLLAWSCFGVAGILVALDAAGFVLLPPRWVTLILCAGAFLLSALLAVGLVDRMRQLGLERDHAQELASSNQRLALYRAHYDAVTHLPNRARFREYLQERLLERDSRQGYALVTLGIDRFGLLNDALGHDIGDSVLGEIAKRMRAQLGNDTLIARVGADLFAWLAGPHVGTDLPALKEHCTALQEAVTAPLHLANGARLTASIGIALCPDHASSAELLLQYSDAALHRAKIRGPGQLQVFDPGFHLSATHYLELNKALYRALERDELELHYQPIVALSGGELLGAEALVRWATPDGLSVSPDQFVPLVQSGDLLRPFTEWGLRCHGRQLADWESRGVVIPYASFNLSAQQLRLPGIEQLILQALQSSRAPLHRVVIEVTEGSLLDNLEGTAEVLSRLKQYGIGVAVDDFGVGYASPHYLRMLPVDILKLDGIFLRGVPQEPEATSVLSGLITLGHSLSLKIVCECVETEAQVQYLASRGVRGGQGFFFSPALAPPAFEAWIRARGLRAA